MTFVRKQPAISGNFIIDGTLEAKHIKANTITANKFSGSVEEEYWAYTDDVDVSWSYGTYYTVFDFYFPKTELDLFKGRHVSWNAEGYHNTASGSRSDATFTFRLEVEVPEAQTTTVIGSAVHQSNPASGYQLVAFEGNLASNRIGSGGSIGTVGGNFRTYKNLYYDPYALQGSEKIANGNFNATTDWTTGAGGQSIGFGTMSVSAPASGNGFVYQAITTIVGEEYELTTDIQSGGTTAGMVIASTEASLDTSKWLGNSTAYSAAITVDVKFTATSTTTYIILATASATAQYQYRLFDNVSVKQYLRRTYMWVSTTGGNIVPTDGSEVVLYYHPYSGASAGTYAIIDTMTDTRRLKAYTNKMRFSQEAYIGWTNENIKMRIRSTNQGAFGKTLTLNDLKIFMQSRIVE